MGKNKTKKAAVEAVREIAIDRKINKYALDDAAISQADFFGYYADQKPDLKTEIDNMKIDLKALQGEKFSHYKATLDGGVDSKGNAKDPTDGAVNKAIDCDKEVITLQKDIIAVENALAKIDVALTTLDQRRSMIKVTQQLFSDEYWDNKRAVDTEEMGQISSTTKKKAAKAIMEEKVASMEVEEEIDEEIEEEIEEKTIEEKISEEPESENIVEEVFDEKEEEESGEEDGADPEEEPEEDGEDDDSGSEQRTTNNNEIISDEVILSCPFNFVFGDDFGEYAECDDCELESECWKKSKEK